MSKTNKIELNTGTYMDLDKLIYSRLLIQANSGGGKSWGIRRIIEQSHGKVQQIIIDSEGEFGTLREKYDFILVGKGGDTPADPRSASLLARKLLEIGVSAIIDLYELHPQDRKRFVKEFLNGMINAPKELWHECLVVVDEAHIYAPEKGQSEALDAVIGLMSLGRKRGFCGVLATQRISKLHKDAAAECNNKMIGRTGLDIDMKRASEELGFTSKEQTQSLRRLKPGDFYVFGPALSEEVVSITIGPVNTSHARSGAVIKITPPTEAIKKVLGQLGDLPEEAKKEAQTMDELRAEIKSLTIKLSQHPQKNVEIDLEKSLEPHLIAFRSVENGYKNKIELFNIFINNLFGNIENFIFVMEQLKKEIPSSDVGASYAPEKAPLKAVERQSNLEVKPVPEARPVFETNKPVVATVFNNDGKIGQGEMKVLNSIAQFPEGISREHITLLTGYKRSSRDAYLQRLRQKGYLEIYGDGFIATNEGLNALGSNFKPVPTGAELREHLMNVLPGGEKAILKVLFDNHPNAVSRDYLSDVTNYQRSSRDAYLQRLNVRKLIITEGRGFVKANPKLF